ncbi:sugar-transfer associated ATP-grasp domain-containing protein [Aestuariicoccus sp. MJ-SS9]|uniref:sugar-transfer associated ATP-grasp domain-containing protein n=1 Tax=Aestuariicoccus sp. MJ-SS9 TaxID=3079855 RepID=UPI00290B9DE3|nr:sugar-transfer associated ATP-grasp domain-containing protein [Aestuariicoccus sp. MJ-SS9]MDU8913853.1 sugar-transfer associated ATP-grasp domain-containing protein [Aestuariicoccus sp. MJ-SS9]
MNTTRDLKAALKAGIARAELMRLTRRSRAEARAGLAALGRARGGLNPKFAANAQAYARDVLGSEHHAEWLQLYAECQRVFREGWFPETYYHEKVRPRINGLYHRMAEFRAANTRLLGTEWVPDAAFVVNGRMMRPDGTTMRAAELREIAERFVFKPDHSAFGKGIRFLEVRELDGLDLGALGNGVLQPLIRPHESFAEFGTRALATLRIGTVLQTDGTPEVRTAYLKLGRARETHVVAASQVRVPVDWATGSLSTEGFLADWRPMTAHPDTGRAFEGHRLENIAACTGAVLAMHRKVPFARYLCWDVVVDASGAVQLLEWEGGVVSFAEATQGPCFADLGWEASADG